MSERPPDDAIFDTDRTSNGTADRSEPAHSGLPLPHPLAAVTAAEMREMDRRASDEFAVPSLLLMENAGAAVARAAQAMLSRTSARVAIIAGGGNNGGDGVVAARHLHAAGHDVRVTLTGPEDRVQGDARANLEMARRAGVPVGVV